MGQEEELLTPTKIFDEFDFQGGTNMSPSSLLINLISLPSENYINQLEIIQQYQKQIATITAQLQVLLNIWRGVETAEISRSNTGFNIEVVMPQTFNKEVGKVLGFVTVCKLFIVEEQMHWVLSYMQEGAADIWKENVLEDLGTGIWEFEMVGEILKEIKKKLGGGDDK